MSGSLPSWADIFTEGSSSFESHPPSSVTKLCKHNGQHLETYEISYPSSRRCDVHSRGSVLRMHCVHSSAWAGSPVGDGFIFLKIFQMCCMIEWKHYLKSSWRRNEWEKMMEIIKQMSSLIVQWLRLTVQGGQVDPWSGN